MMRVVFRLPLASDLDALAATMRDIDAKECVLMSGRSPRETLGQCVAEAAWSSVAEIDGRVVCIFGLTEASMLGGDAYPWMLCAKGIERHARELLTCAPRFVGEMRAQCERLSNLVHADNRAAIRFIRWCGFDLGEAVEVGGERFVRFAWDKPALEAA